MTDNRKWTAEEILLYAQTGKKPGDAGKFMPAVGIVAVHRDRMDGTDVEYVRSKEKSDVLQVVCGNTVSSKVTLVRAIRHAGGGYHDLRQGMK